MEYTKIVDVNIMKAYAKHQQFISKFRMTSRKHRLPPITLKDVVATHSTPEQMQAASEALYAEDDGIRAVCTSSHHDVIDNKTFYRIILPLLDREKQWS